MSVDMLLLLCAMFEVIDFTHKTRYSHTTHALALKLDFGTTMHARYIAL